VNTIKEGVVVEALLLIARHCPRLISRCYWAGTSSVAVEELHHRESFDLDFHTRHAHENTSGIMMELRAAFADNFKVVQSPDEFGSGFQGLLRLPSGEEITLEVLASYESVQAGDIEDAHRVPGLKRVTLSRYLQDKIQCVAERSEARDLIDIMAVLGHAPALESVARNTLAEQDALLVTERLTAWTDDNIDKDLAAYKDVKSEFAKHCRDLLKKWLKEADA
jgi:hypothetical protein